MINNKERCLRGGTSRHKGPEVVFQTSMEATASRTKPAMQGLDYRGSSVKEQSCEKDVSFDSTRGDSHCHVYLAHSLQAECS